MTDTAETRKAQEELHYLSARFSEYEVLSPYQRKEYLARALDLAAEALTSPSATVEGWREQALARLDDVIAHAEANAAASTKDDALTWGAHARNCSEARAMLSAAPPPPAVRMPGREP